MDNSMNKKLETVNQICDMIDDIYYQYASTFGLDRYGTLYFICFELSIDGEYLQEATICR